MEQAARIPKFGDKLSHAQFSYHGTEAELLYLRHLGKWSKQGRLSREELLKRYISASALRQRWGCIEEKLVLQFAADQLFCERNPTRKEANENNSRG